MITDNDIKDIERKLQAYCRARQSCVSCAHLKNCHLSPIHYTIDDKSDRDLCGYENEVELTKAKKQRFL